MPGVKKVVQVGGGVEALDLAAHHRAFLDRGVEHAGQLDPHRLFAAGGTYHAES